MDWLRHGTSKREFDRFAAEAWEPLLRTGYLMTGDAKDAEDLVQETLLKVARQRAVLVLRYWADLPVAEVAGILGCSEGTVTSTASRAAVRLAQALAYHAPPATQTRGPQP